jgi:hypothetical protein
MFVRPSVSPRLQVRVHKLRILLLQALDCNAKASLARCGHVSKQHCGSSNKVKMDLRVGGRGGGAATHRQQLRAGSAGLPVPRVY